jgi:hypothetical protein
MRLSHPTLKITVCVNRPVGRSLPPTPKQGAQMSLLKSIQKCWPPHFLKINTWLLQLQKVAKKNWVTSVIFEKPTNRKHSQVARKMAQSGHPSSKQVPFRNQSGQICESFWTNFHPTIKVKMSSKKYKLKQGCQTVYFQTKNPNFSK